MLLVKQLIIGGLDDATVHLTAADLNGFTFEFYGEQYDELFYSTNGLITFGSANAEGQNTYLTDPPPQASIAVFWEDLATGSGDREAVFWEVRDSGDGQQLIIQWNDVRLTNPLAQGQEPLKFQAVLNESDNSIQFNYVHRVGFSAVRCRSRPAHWFVWHGPAGFPGDRHRSGWQLCHRVDGGRSGRQRFGHLWPAVRCRCQPAHRRVPGQHDDCRQPSRMPRSR